MASRKTKSKRSKFEESNSALQDRLVQSDSDGNSSDHDSDRVTKKRYSSSANGKAVPKPRKECKNCGKTMLCTSFTSHFKLCTSDGTRPFQCTKKGCKATFRASHEISKHIWSVHSEPIECPFPDCSVIVKKRSLSTHLKMVHERVKQECPNCGKKLSYGNLGKHVGKCARVGSHRRFICMEEGCCAHFKTERKRVDHVRAVHIQEPIVDPLLDFDDLGKKRCLELHVSKDSLPNAEEKQCQNYDNEVIANDNLTNRIESETKNQSDTTLKRSRDISDIENLTTANLPSREELRADDMGEIEAKRARTSLALSPSYTNVVNAESRISENAQKSSESVICIATSDDNKLDTQFLKDCKGVLESAEKKLGSIIENNLSDSADSDIKIIVSDRPTVIQYIGKYS